MPNDTTMTTPSSRPAGSDLSAMFSQTFVRKVGPILLIPLLLTVLLGAMFLALTQRLKDVEVGTRLVNIERLLLKDKNYPWAIAEYEKIAAERPSAAILARLGDLYFRASPKKNVDAALEKLAMAQRLDDRSWETYQVLTYVYVSTGREADAVRAGTRALELNPYDASTCNNLAWLYATSTNPALRDLPAAMVYAERAVELTQGKQAFFVDTLAEVYHRHGADHHPRARELMRQAIALAPREEVGGFREHYSMMFPNDKP